MTLSSNNQKFAQATQLARQGRKSEARTLLCHIVKTEPNHQAAWIWLSALIPKKEAAESALKHARQINPHHPSLPKAERWLKNRFSDPSPKKNSKFNGLIIGIFSLLLLSLLLLFGLTFPESSNLPQLGIFTHLSGFSNTEEQIKQDKLEIAWQEQDWARAIPLLEELYQTDPTSEKIRYQLVSAYLQQGITLRRQSQVKEAIAYFNHALKIAPQLSEAQQERLLAVDYLISMQYYQAGHWSDAIVILKDIQRRDKEYTNIQDMLFSAYFNQGLAYRAVDQLDKAKEALKTAITLHPDLPEPRRHLAEVELEMMLDTIPPSTPVEDKLIVVGIAEQRMHVYEGDQLIFDFIVSTGEPGRDTAIGDFEILDKIDMAYASTWNLDMPYWMGIYWSGTLENGIHGLPTVKHTGYTLWDGFLGQRVSYGCIILSLEDVATLYEWAEVGIKVKIVPSLTEWERERET